MSRRRELRLVVAGPRFPQKMRYYRPDGLIGLWLVVGGLLPRSCPPRPRSNRDHGRRRPPTFSAWRRAFRPEIFRDELTYYRLRNLSVLPILDPELRQLTL